MSKETATTNDERLTRLREASEWIVRMDDPIRTEDDMNEWLRWCDSNPENLAAFELFQRDYRELESLKIRQVCADPPAESRGSVRKTRPRWMFAVAAAIALVAIAAALLYPPSTDTIAPREVSAREKNRSATLPDGSKVILAAETMVKVDFTGTARKLDLSAGLAYFKVKHDPGHPFIVSAGEVRVTAIGTAFDVRRDVDRITVTVEEGIVDVASSAGRASWRAEAGYQLSYSTRERTATLARIDPESSLKWHNGELEYVHEPLGTVVDDLNRYSSRKIVIRDQRIAEMRFTGTAFIGDVEDWLRAVQDAYPIEALEQPDGEIVLTERK